MEGTFVMPAQAGIQGVRVLRRLRAGAIRVPTFAGMTAS